MVNKTRDDLQLLKDQEKVDKRVRNSLQKLSKRISPPNPIPVLSSPQFSLVTLTIPGGSLHGKWWGPKNVRPILGLHGLLDNCGVFDKLIPLLPREFAYLVFDLPGHGYSFKYPPGMVYTYYDYVILIERIRREYGWDKVSFMGHSLGSHCGFFYAAMYPDQMDLFLALEAFEPHIATGPVMMDRNLRDFFRIEDEAENRDAKSEPPAYSYPELVDKWVKGSNGSVDVESAKYLLLRNVRRSKKYPKKYYFDYDRRCRALLHIARHHEEILQFGKMIKVPILYVVSEDSYLKKLTFEKNEKVREYFQENKREFSVFYGPGNHHSILTHAEAYAEVISGFLRKHRPIVGAKL